MADDVSANINVNFDTREALRSLRQLQAGLSRFNQALTQGNVAAANAQKGLTDQLIQSINATGKFVASQKEISTSTKQFTDALEKNKFSLREYWRYTAATATQNTKVFSKAWAAEREIITRAAKDRVKLLQSQYIQLNNANGEFVKVLQVIPKHLRTVNGEVTDYATRVQLAAQRQQFLNQLIKQGSTQLLNWGKNTQWAGRQLMVGLTIPLTMLGSTASRVFMDMEQALLKFQRVYGDTFTSTGDVQQAVEDIQRLAKEFTKYGIAVKDTVEMASNAAAMGLTGEALQAQVRQATRLSVLGQVEQQQALETTISLQNAFGISTDQLAQKINFLNAVENQTVLSIEDLTIAIPKAGPVVKQLGGSVEDLAFFMTAMKEGGINASEGANALKSGLASIINPTKKTSEMLAEFGINIKGIVEANAGDLKGTVLGFAQALDTLDPLNRARAIEQLFGKFQFARLSTLFQNVAKDGTQAARAFNLAGASVEELAILSERELGKVEDATSTKFKKAIEQLKVELIPVGKAFLQAVTPIVEFIGNILKKFNGLSDGTKKVVTIITATLGAIAPVALMTIGLVANGVANLIKFFGMLRSGMSKLNGQNQVLGGGFDYLTQQEIENLAETNALHTSHQQLISTFNVEAGAANALAAAYANATSPARALAASAPGLFNTVPGAGGAVSGLPNATKFAEGGVVPGTGNKDTVPALLTPGEVVLTKDTVKENPEIVAALQNDSVKKYSTGTGRMRNVTTSQSDFISTILKSGNVQPNVEDQIAKQFEQINNASSEKLIAYAKATGKAVSDASEESLAALRDSLIEDVKKVIKDAADAAAESGRILTGNAVRSSVKEKGTAGADSSLHEFYNPRAKQQFSSQFGHAEKSSTYSIDALERVANITDRKAKDEANFIIDAITKHNAKTGANVAMPKVTPVSGFGFDLLGTINKGMNDKAAQVKMPGGQMMDTIDAFIKDFSERGPEKWRKAVEIGGGSFEQLSASIKEYDDKLLSAVQDWKTQNPGKIFSDADFASIEQQVRGDLLDVQSGLGAVFEEAKSVVTAIRLKLTQQQKEILNAAGGSYDESRSTFQMGGSETRNKTGKGRFISDEVSADLDRAEEIAETNSPSKRTERLGKDIGDGLVSGLEQKENAVKSQADQLAEAAVPRRSAAETAEKTRKMDLTNKAFYDDINTPEMRDQRQVLKSLDRQRRKKGVGRGAVKPIEDIVGSAGTAGASIRISAKKTTKSTKVLADKTEEAANTQEEIAAVLKDDRDIKVKIKGNTVNINEATEQTAQAQEQVKEATQEQLAIAEQASGKKASQVAQNAEDQAGITSTTTDVMTDVKDNITTTGDVVKGTKDELIAQEQIVDAIGQAEIERQATLTERQIIEEQINDAKQQELMAARQNAQDAASNMPADDTRLSQADALAEASDYARDENGHIVMDQNGPMSKKKYTKMKRGMRREKVGRMSGKISGGLGMATVAAGMMGAPPQVTAALGGASMVAQFAPMIAGMGPIGLTVTALAALGAGAYMLNQHFNKMAAEAAKFVTATSATRESMKKMGQITGKVGASEIMDRRRQGTQYNKYNESIKIDDTFGKKFLSDKYGQEELAVFRKNMQQFSAEKATTDLGLKLAAQVSDGVLTTAQAESIAHAMALELGDQTLEMQIAGKVRTLVGPNGEKLEKEPINVRMNLVANARARSEKIRANIKTGNYDQNQRKDIASLASYSMNTLELAQMQADAVAMEHDEAKKKLETEIASTTNLQKKVDLQTELDKLTATQAQETAKMNNLILMQIYQAEQDFRAVQSNSVWGGQAMREDAFFDASKSNVLQAYKGTQYEDSSKKFLERTAGIGTTQYNKKTGAYDTTGFKTQADAQTFQAKMQMLVGSKVLNPDEATSWMKLFKGELNQLDFLINAGIKLQGAGKTKELFNLFADFKNKKLAKGIIANLIMRKKDPAEFDASMEALKNLKSMDGLTIDMEVVLKSVGLEAIQKQMEAIEGFKKTLGKDEKYADEKGGTAALDRLGKENPQLQGAVDALKANQERMDEFRKLDQESQTEYLQKLAAGVVYEANIKQEQLDADAATWANIQLAMDEKYQNLIIGSEKWEEARQKLMAEYTDKDANARAVAKLDPVVVSSVTPKTGDNTPLDKGKGTNPLDFLDDLAQRLKNVRDGAFNAMTPLKSILALFNSKKAKKDVANMVTLFDGLQHRLLKLKVPAEFRDYIASLSNEDFKALANLKGDKQLFKFAKDPKTGKELPRTKANIRGLTRTGEAVMQTYREVQLGDVNVAQKAKILEIQDQQKAFDMLVASGMSAENALDQVQDTAMASAIAMGAAGKAGSKEMNQFVKDINSATEASKRYEVISNVIRKNEEFRAQQSIPMLVSSMKALGYSTEQIDEVLSDPELAKQLNEDLKDGKIDAKAIADYINSIPARKIIEIQTNLNKGDYAAAAQEGMDYVDRLFQVQENLIRTGADPRSTKLVDEFKANERALKDKNKQAEQARREIDSLQKEITKIQREIDETFNKPIEKMQKQIDVNQRALEVGGAYKIQGKEMVLPYKLSGRYMEELNQENSKLSNDLTIIGHQSDEINKKYDAQAEALRKVKEVNDQIIQQQKDQLDLADAITSGDISAAARAAQQSRANMAATYADQQMAALDQARQNELGALTGAESGLTQEQIQERQYQIGQELYRIETSPERMAIKNEQVRLEDEIYKLEQLREVKLKEIEVKEKAIYDIQVNKLEPLEEEIRILEDANAEIQDQIDKLVEQIKVQGMSKDEWERIKAKIEASDLAAKNMDVALAGLLAASQAISKEWDAILAKLRSYSTVSANVSNQAASFTATTTANAKENPVTTAQTATDSKTDAQKKVDEQIKTLTDLRSTVEVNSALGFKLKEQIDELKSTGGSLFSRIPVVDEQTKMAGMKASLNVAKNTSGGGGGGGRFGFVALSSGGLVKPKYFANGGLNKGTDTVPAMLTPGEFVMSRYAVDSYGVNTMKAINGGTAIGDSVYNYSINVNVKSDANPDEIAQAVMTNIQRVNSQQLRSVRL